MKMKVSEEIESTKKKSLKEKQDKLEILKAKKRERNEKYNPIMNLILSKYRYVCICTISFK